MARVKEPRPLPATDSSWFRLLQKAPPRERLMALLAGEDGMRRAGVAVACFDLIETTATATCFRAWTGAAMCSAPTSPTTTSASC
jgi:hypothetical protein